MTPRMAAFVASIGLLLGVVDVVMADARAQEGGVPGVRARM